MLFQSTTEIGLFGRNNVALSKPFKAAGHDFEKTICLAAGHDFEKTICPAAGHDFEKTVCPASSEKLLKT